MYSAGATIYIPAFYVSFTIWLQSVRLAADGWQSFSA